MDWIRQQNEQSRFALLTGSFSTEVSKTPQLDTNMKLSHSCYCKATKITAELTVILPVEHKISPLPGPWGYLLPKDLLLQDM